MPEALIAGLRSCGVRYFDSTYIQEAAGAYYVEIGDRTFVRRISCCLVYEVPGCEMCTSCPKRPSAEREQLLTRMAAQD
ncbi:(2Fe-2S)-binding protein [Nocardia cyriacigeorgica]|uniref:(2Fe-2S)-binding protein n=1 Tax=Nocardia cyriacigeorgica TaxID=135487 RepID=UPI0024573269|nr:(2Fe-2S)-binding protein [Nocardia cyriacigeorgica]